MKKFLAVILAIVVVFSMAVVAGCGENPNKTDAITDGGTYVGSDYAE